MVRRVFFDEIKNVWYRILTDITNDERSLNKCTKILAQCKKGWRFSRPQSGLMSLVSDIPAGDGKIANRGLQCTQSRKLLTKQEGKERMDL